MSVSRSLWYRSEDGSERLFYPGLADGSNPSKAQSSIPLLSIFIFVFVANVMTFGKRTHFRRRGDARPNWLHEYAQQPRARSSVAMVGLLVLALCFGMSIVNSWTRVSTDDGTRMDFGVLGVRIQTRATPSVPSIKEVYTYVCETDDRIQYSTHMTQCRAVRMGGILTLIYEIVAAVASAGSVCLGLRGIAVKEFPRALWATSQMTGLALMCTLLSWTFSGHFLQQETFAADSVSLSSSWIMCLTAWIINLCCIHFWNAYAEVTEPPPEAPAVVAVQVRPAPIVEVPLLPASASASSAVELTSASPPGGPACDAAPMPEPAPREVVLRLGGMAPPLPDAPAPAYADASAPPPYAAVFNEETGEVRL